jgi:hypothetical protein
MSLAHFQVHRMTLAALAFVMAMAGSLVHADTSLDDYDPADTSWRGLSRLVELMTGQGVALQVRGAMDFRALSPDDVLFIIYPEQELDRDNLANFVIEGGRVFLADDFGLSDRFLERLSLSRMQVSQGHLPHDTFVDDRAGFPVFEPRGRHPLLEGVGQVVANHPAVLFNVGGPVIAYSEGGGLVYDMSLGKGRAVVFADASLLINQMLAVADNEVLVANTVAYLCEGRLPCRVQLLVGHWEEQGSFQSADRGASGAVARKIERLNETLRTLLADLPTGELFYYLSLLLVAGLAAYLATVFPLRPFRNYSRYILDATRAVPAPQTEFDWNLSRFGAARGGINFILPMAILKETFEEIFLTGLGLWPSTARERPGVEELARQFAERYLQGVSGARRRRLEEEVTDVLATFAQIPTRHRVFLDSEAFFGEREMLRHYRRARKILEIMGLEEEYERRTKHIP